MRTTPRFVKPNDFENYTGKNLNQLLRIDQNRSNVANLFLMQVEDKLLARTDKNSFRTTHWDRLTDFQLESLQKAIILQAEYILRNSDIFTDSGYDLDKGEIITREKLNKIAICESSLDLLFNCGIYSHVITNYGRFVDFD